MNDNKDLPAEEQLFNEESAGTAEDKEAAEQALKKMEGESTNRKIAALDEQLSTLQDEMTDMTSQGFDPTARLVEDQNEFVRRIDELKKNLETNPSPAGESVLEALEIENALLVDALKDLESKDVAAADLHLAKKGKEATDALEKIGNTPELKARLVELGGKIISLERQRSFLKRIAKEKKLGDEINRLKGGQA